MNAYIKKLNNPICLKDFSISKGKYQNYFFDLKKRSPLKYNMILNNHINYETSYQIFIKKYQKYLEKIIYIYSEYFSSRTTFIDWIISLDLYKTKHFFNCLRNIEALIFSKKSLLDYSEKQLLNIERIVKEYDIMVKHQ